MFLTKDLQGTSREMRVAVNNAEPGWHPGSEVRTPLAPVRCMRDSLDRAARYRELANECLSLSERAADDEARAHYCKMAENYLIVARAELTRAEQGHIRKQRQQR
jgi:hypothetical protein